MTIDEWRSLVLAPRRVFRRRLFGIPAVGLLAAIPPLVFISTAAVQQVGLALGYDDNAIVLVPLGLVFPLLVAAAGAALLPGRGELAAFRQARGLCIRCRYRLGSGKLETCPECGAGQGSSPQSPPRPGEGGPG